MEDMTIFNLCAVNKGALKATVSIRLASGLIIHDCKILQQDGLLSAKLPQRSERLKGGEVVYHDLVEFADPRLGRLLPRGLWLITRLPMRVLTSQSPQRPHHRSESAKRRRSNPHRKP
jgi:hypothetical protein